MVGDVVIVAGFGFREGASIESLVDALTLAQAGQPAVTLLATLVDKMALVERLAGLLNLPFFPVRTEALGGMATITQSPIAYAARGTGSVAEAVALVAAGPGGALLAARHVSLDRMATCALARGMAQ